MPVFGVSVQDACKESGGLPRVVAETIAWLDAHGESTYIVWGRAPARPESVPPAQIPHPSPGAPRSFLTIPAPSTPNPPSAVGVKPTENMFKVRGDHNKIQECRMRYDRNEVMPLKGCERRARRRGRAEALPSPRCRSRFSRTGCTTPSSPSRRCLDAIAPGPRTRLPARLARRQRQAHALRRLCLSQTSR